MRIAIVTETFVPKVDGIVTRLTRTIEHLVQAGHEVLVVAPEGGIKDYAGARVLGIPSPPLPLYSENRIVLPRPHVAAAVAAFGPDIIHVAAPVVIGSAAVGFARARRLPLVASYHTHFPRYVHSFGAAWLESRAWRGVRLMHGCADVNLCTSAPIKAELEAHGIPRLDVWQRAVDSQRFHPTRANAAMRARLSNGAPDQPLLLYAGRLAPEKDLETLAALMARLPDVRLALVGDGPQRSALERMLPGSRTTFTGYLHGDELATAFASSDVFVLPSRTETLGLVALEAMASGCAVVAARAGGIPDLVTDDLTGYLYEPGDPDALMAAVRRALGASESRTDDPLRVRARREAERWTWSAATRQLETFYRAAQQSQVHLAPVRRLAAAQNTVVATSILIQILAGLFAASLRLRARAA